jgi:hypothetical protein
MDNSPEGVSPDLLAGLSYDDTVAYEEQLPTHPPNDLGHASLADRIGNTKVYLLSESRVGKVRWACILGGVREKDLIRELL